MRRSGTIRIDTRAPKAKLKPRALMVRTSDDEKAGFALAAAHAGLSLSAWMRYHLRAAATRELDAIGWDVPFRIAGVEGLGKGADALAYDGQGEMEDA